MGFHLNALYASLGWPDWIMLAKQYEKAKKELAKGDQESMKLFYSMWLAEVWDGAEV